MKFDVIEYLGKLNGGVLTLLSINHNGVFYDATFYYTEELVALTVDVELENVLETTIENWEGYGKLIIDIGSKVVPLSEIIVRLDELEIYREDEDKTDISTGI